MGIDNELKELCRRNAIKQVMELITEYEITLDDLMDEHRRRAHEERNTNS